WFVLFFFFFTSIHIFSFLSFLFGWSGGGGGVVFWFVVCNGKVVVRLFFSGGLITPLRVWFLDFRVIFCFWFVLSPMPSSILSWGGPTRIFSV
ncbi:hypothetical protein ACQWG0_24580, partial [Salmonella enterica subsp. enterica serovar Infantis]